MLSNFCQNMIFFIEANAKTASNLKQLETFSTMTVQKIIIPLVHKNYISSFRL